jgi:uncharacterized membrane protein YbhN (UPF0104 family)
MNNGAANELEAASPPRSGGAQRVAIFAVKLFVTVACFWYASRQIDWRQVLSAIPLLDFRWAALAVLVAILQLPLLGLRWRNVLDALAMRHAQVTRTAMIAATAVGVFFNQVLPNVAGEGVRAWLLVRLGCDWGNAVTSVVIDRGVGVGLLIALGFAVLLLPSGLTALGEYRHVVLVVYGSLILTGMLGLMVTPTIVPPLARWRYSRWFATLAADIHRVLLGSKGPVILSIGCLLHALTAVVVWFIGRAQGFALPLPDAAVLCVVMTGVAVVPISISGWGLRELAVISLLGYHGVPAEKALLFSVGFGLVFAVGSLPGALVWLLYSFAPTLHSAAR